MNRWIKAPARLLLLLATTLLAVPAAAQEEVGIELDLQTELTFEYELYLSTIEEILRDAIANGFDIDAARTGLALVLIAQLQFETDAAAARLEDARYDLESDLDELLTLVLDEIQDADPETPEALAAAIADRMFLERSKGFEEEVEVVASRMEEAGDEMSSAIADLGGATFDSVDEIDQLFHELSASTDEFLLTVYLDDGTDLYSYEITRADVDALSDYDPSDTGGQDLADLLGIAGGDLEALVDNLDAVAENLTAALDILEQAASPEDNEILIGDLREAVADLDLALGNLEDALDDSPLALSMREVGDLLTDLDDMLGGREFVVGDMTVRPAALIESRTAAAAPADELVAVAVALSVLAQSEFGLAAERETDRSEKARLRGWLWVMLAAGAVGLTDSPDALMLEFYSASDPRAHTFRGYFPDGLSGAMLELIGADMVVNANATRDEFDAYLTELRRHFRQRADVAPDDAEARAGLALIRTYFTLAGNRDDLTDLAGDMAAGDIISFVDRLETTDLDLQSPADSTREDTEAALQDPDIVFLILNKLDDDGAPLTVEKDDHIMPFPLTHDPLAAILDRVQAVNNAAAGLAATVDETASNADHIFELDLDPNELDFSDADSALEMVQALERSNENFLAVTQQGHDDLIDAGDRIERGLADFTDAVSGMRELMEEMEAETGSGLGGLTAATVEFDEFYADVHRDFAVVGEVTVIDGSNVDLSAWFEKPPESVLQRFKWYLDDDDMTDNTLAGFLPGDIDRSVIVESTVADLPGAFALNQNFPNPFNRGTVIPFALARSGPIDLALYNVQGQRLLTLASGHRARGSYRIAWDGTDDRGRSLATGIYLYRLTAPDQTKTQRLILLR